MSLDVYLNVKEPIRKMCSSGIFIREDGQTKEISEEEWVKRFGDQIPCRIAQSEETEETTEVYHANITHNLNKMADACGLYKPLWRPDEIGIKTAKELIQPLAKGLAILIKEKEAMQVFNPSNGWGNYEALVRFTANYLLACIEYPDAEVGVWE